MRTNWRVFYAYCFPEKYSNRDLLEACDAQRRWSFGVGANANDSYGVFSNRICCYLHDFGVMDSPDSRSVAADDFRILFLSRGQDSYEDLIRLTIPPEDRSYQYCQLMRTLYTHVVSLVSLSMYGGPGSCGGVVTPAFYVGGCTKQTMLRHMQEDDPVYCKEVMQLLTHRLPRYDEISAVVGGGHGTNSTVVIFDRDPMDLSDSDSDYDSD